LSSSSSERGSWCFEGRIEELMRGRAARRERSVVSLTMTAEGDITSRYPVAVALVMKATNNLLRFVKSYCFTDGNDDVLEIEARMQLRKLFHVIWVASQASAKLSLKPYRYDMGCSISNCSLVCRQIQLQTPIPPLQVQDRKDGRHRSRYPILRG
jgi:hypothetical protein